MKTLAIRNFTLYALLILAPAAFAQTEDPSQCNPILQHEFQRVHDVKTQNLCESHHGKVLLIVNTASRCGFTPQFEGLETLYQTYKDRGFSVLGFPSNDFYQELAEEKDIASFCKENYGVSFPMFSASSVRGKAANPLYQQLIAATDKAPKWNFYKYLIDRNGNVVGVYSSRVEPESEELTSAIENLLEK